jgi:hypothetical protein
MKHRTVLRWTMAVTLFLLATSGVSQAAGQRRLVERTDKPELAFLPAAQAPAALGAPILGGLDYTAVAPPGTRIRVVENEPYIYLSGTTSRRRTKVTSGTALIVLHATAESGGEFTARVSLRWLPGGDSGNVLRLAFDTAAHYDYAHSMLADERRGALAYALNEVRSPLGLTDPRDRHLRDREYLVYSATLVNPQVTESTGNWVTPYLAVAGRLKVLERTTDAHWLLTVDFSASNFAYSVALAENVARCVVNRLELLGNGDRRLDYVPYHPEYEPFIAYFEGEVPNPATADLVERPGEGCGAAALPITGDVCPQCGAALTAPAQPYGDSGPTFGAQDAVGSVCSHCLFGAGEYPDAIGADLRKTPCDAKCGTPCGDCERRKCMPARCVRCSSSACHRCMPDD